MEGINCLKTPKTESQLSGSLLSQKRFFETTVGQDNNTIFRKFKPLYFYYFGDFGQKIGQNCQRNISFPEKCILGLPQCGN